MRRRNSIGRWLGRAAALLIITGVAAYLLSVGLDRADKLASALSLLVGLLALSATYLLPAPGADAREGGSQTVDRSEVGGRLVQARRIAGSLRAARGPRPTTPAPPAAPGSWPPAPGEQSPGEHPPGGRPPAGPGAQRVEGTRVGGDLTQVDGVDGEVSLG